MQPSITGLIVCAGLLLLGWLMRAPLIVALFASLAFGATAFGTISALGGSSPLICTAFALLLLAAVVLRRDLQAQLKDVFARFPVAWVLVALVCYAIAGAVIMPRLFEGETTVFTTTNRTGAAMSGAVVETLLAPVAGNITQTCYFTLGSLTFFALLIVLRRGHNVAAVRRGFLVMCAFTAVLGIADLTGKLFGQIDILLPIRTASYSMGTRSAEAGFWRIAGGAPEASYFATAALSSLAFTFTYWRSTGSRIALLLAVTLLGLLVLSTSTTAYAGLVVLIVPVTISLAVALLRGQLSTRDQELVFFGLVGLTAVIVTALVQERVANTFVELLETTVLNKPSSASALERGYWNAKSLEGLVDTAWLGVGFGSSRASSWIVAVVSQLGIIGSLLMGIVIAQLLFGFRAVKARGTHSKLAALGRSARACALALLVAQSMNAGSADPGVLFFICLAVMLSCREHAMHRRMTGGLMSRRAIDPSSI